VIGGTLPEERLAHFDGAVIGPADDIGQRETAGRTDGGERRPARDGGRGDLLGGVDDPMHGGTVAPERPDAALGHGAEPVFGAQTAEADAGGITEEHADVIDRDYALAFEHVADGNIDFLAPHRGVEGVEGGRVGVRLHEFTHLGAGE
jgi:hypothetical protein